jgi:DNA-binding HxlR family transcriptional regulator
MTGQPPSDLSPLLDVFKAVADESRLKIIGLLARQPYTVEQLAALLGLRPSTVSHHLAKLAEVGLVSARAESYYNLYRLETGALDSLARRLLSPADLPAAAAEVDLQAYDRKVIADFSLPDGRLKTIPAQRKKLEVILRHVGRAFEAGRRYPEGEVNDLLRRFHQDTATLRRELVGNRILERNNGIYWRVAGQEEDGRPLE